MRRQQADNSIVGVQTPSESAVVISHEETQAQLVLHLAATDQKGDHEALGLITGDSHDAVHTADFNGVHDPLFARS